MKFNFDDLVLVRVGEFSKWYATRYSHYDYDVNGHITQNGYLWYEGDIIPYEGNEHLLGTTDKYILQ